MEPTMDCRELFSRLGDDEVLVLDCRQDEEWVGFELQIPGALRMSCRELAEGAHILPDDELIVLCGSLQDHADARRAYRILHMRGRSPVILRGGIRAWVSEGYPTERPAQRAHGGLFAAAKHG